MSTENRDFKGVWIPKEIWLNEELTMLEKVIFVEIDSLDGPDHCYASNEYFATFCNCSESKVSKAIKKLKELGMIEEVSFDGRHRKLKVVKSAMQGSKKCYSESQKVQSNNIASKTDNSINTSKEVLQNFNFGNKQTKQSKKPNLYDRCIQLIDSYDFSSWGNIRKLLIDYLNFRLSVKDKPLYINMWKGMLNKLANLCGDDIPKYEEVIKYCIERGYLSFYEPTNYSSQKNKPWEKGVDSSGYTEEEKRQIENEWDALEAEGLQTWY